MSTYVPSNILPGLRIPRPASDPDARPLRKALDLLLRPDTRQELAFTVLATAERFSASSSDHIAAWGLSRLDQLCKKEGGAYMWDAFRPQTYDRAVTYGLEYVTSCAPSRVVRLIDSAPSHVRPGIVQLIVEYALNNGRSYFANKLRALRPVHIVSHTVAPSAESGAETLDATRPQATI